MAPKIIVYENILPEEYMVYFIEIVPMKSGSIVGHTSHNHYLKYSVLTTSLTGAIDKKYSKSYKYHRL